MSCSPIRGVPVVVSTTWTEPRAASSDPTPVAGGYGWAERSARGVDALNALFRLISPLPCALGSASGSEEAVDVRSFLTWSGLIPGRCCKISAAAPETTAAACEEPDPLKKRELPTRPPG